MKLHGDLCELWLNCGQKYYIRTGWIKSRLAAEEEKKKEPDSTIRFLLRYYCTAWSSSRQFFYAFSVTASGHRLAATSSVE